MSNNVSNAASEIEGRISMLESQLTSLLRRQYGDVKVGKGDADEFVSLFAPHVIFNSIQKAIDGAKLVRVRMSRDASIAEGNLS